MYDTVIFTTSRGTLMCGWHVVCYIDREIVRSYVCFDVVYKKESGSDNSQKLINDSNNNRNG